MKRTRRRKKTRTFPCYLIRWHEGRINFIIEATAITPHEFVGERYNLLTGTVVVSRNGVTLVGYTSDRWIEEEFTTEVSAERVQRMRNESNI